MSVNPEVKATYTVRDPGRALITRRGLAIALYVCIAAVLGLVTLVVPPLIIVGFLLAVSVGVLITLYPYFGLIMYYLVVVVRPESLWPQLAALRPARMILVVLLVSILIHKKYLGQSFVIMRERMSKYMAFFVAALFASVPLAYWPTDSFWFSMDFLWVALYYLVLINILDTEFRLKGFIWLFMLAAGYNAISSTIAYFAGSLVVAQGIERAEGLTGTDPNTLAVTIVLGLPFLYFAINWVKHNILKAVLIAFLAAGVLTVSITGSRSGVIGLVLTAFLIWLVSKHKVVGAMVAVVLLIGGWFALPPQYKTRYASIVSSERDPSSEGRIDAWKAGWGMFLYNPLTGVGVNNFPLAYGSGEFSDTRALLRPHNLYIQIISELGVVGLVAFAALIWFIMRSNFRLRRNLRVAGLESHFYMWLSYAITCSITALFACSMFGHSLFRAHWYFCAALTVALLHLSEELIKSQPVREISNRPLSLADRLRARRKETT